MFINYVREVSVPNIACADSKGSGGKTFLVTVKLSYHTFRERTTKTLTSMRGCKTKSGFMPRPRKFCLTLTTLFFFKLMRGDLFV